MPIIRQVHAGNYGVYGVRKMWRALQRSGHSVGRDQTARIMKIAGVQGKRKGKAPITTRTSRRVDTRPDLVRRNFSAVAPNTLWVTDITYVPTRQGFVYTAFVTDVFSRKIVGWAVSTSMQTEQLPLLALNQAIHTARTTHGRWANLNGLVHHSDRGSQYTSVLYGKTLASTNIDSSTGSVGDSYDNALAENINGSYKNELINNHTRDSPMDVEIATLQWVDWWNTTRLHEALDYNTPEEKEEKYWQQQSTHETIKTR